jgi:hypothetical protein
MFFYDEALELYINDAPLVVSSRVLAISKSLGIQVRWNDKGQICGVTHETSLALAAALGSVPMTVRQYIALAQREPRVASTEFAEWLADTYTYKDSVVFDSNGAPIPMPSARPGWFGLANTDEHGIPITLTATSSLDEWKFWTPCDPTFQSGAIRGFVTSSGTCSLDLGIPVFARHPKLMMREAYRSRPSDLDCPLDHTFAEYQSLIMREKKDDDALKDFLVRLTAEQLSFDEVSNDMMTEKRREMVIDLIGMRRILLDEHEGLQVLTPDHLLSALPLDGEATSVIVLGHPWPDADSLVSAVFEAARRNMLSKTRSHVPWAEYVPPEVAQILGPALGGSIAPKWPEELHTFVLVDCQRSPHAKTSLVQSVIDHHPCSAQYPYYVAQSYDFSWSTTLQVYIKLLGCGFELCPQSARLLAEATTLEAEPELLKYMGAVDQMAFNRLTRIAGSMTGYASLMATMTDDIDREQSFWKDYKEDRFGFAVIKHRKPVATCFVDLARENNAGRHLPVTVVKQVSYSTDFEAVQYEVITLVFNLRFHDKGFRAAVLDVITSSCTAFHGDSIAIHTTTPSTDTTSITLTGTHSQTPRLLLLPLVTRIVDEHLRFAYSISLDRYIACGFYFGAHGGSIYGSPGDALQVQARLCFREVKTLVDLSANVTFLSLSEYWTVLREFAEWKHVTMSLTDDVYVELLDTEIHQRDDGKWTVSNGRQPLVAMKIPPAHPAQLLPSDCREVNGIPTRLVSPNIYDDDSLWRYWSPDSAVNVATRGHIFLLDRPCIDLKIKANERTARLTFRPVYKDIPNMRYEIVRTSGRWVEVVIRPRLYTIFEADQLGL